MNIVNKLTLRHLKENKGRTLVTTFGIIVSVAMITAVFVAMASCLQMFLLCQTAIMPLNCLM